MKKIVLILLTLFPVTSFGATYYVDKFGNDTSPGTLSQPWATIQKAASTLVAGDTVYVRGGIYYEQVTPANSGTDDSKITYAAYSGEVSIIDGTGVSPKETTWGGLFNIVGGKSHIILKGFTIRNTASIPGTPGLAGVLIVGGHDVTVTQCSIRNTRSSGIGVWNSTNTPNLKTYITHNDIQQAVNGGSQECLTIAESSYVDVSYNSVHNGVNLDIAGEGINAKGGVSYIDIHHNKVYDLPGEISIYVDAYDNTLSNVNIYANEIYDSGSGIGLACEQGGTIDGIHIYNNVVHNTASRGIELTSLGEGHRKNVEIFNNTVYGNFGGIKVESTEVSNIEIYNNISACNSNYQLQVASTVNITTSYNLWYGTQGTYKGTNYLTTNPAFVSTTDFHLQSKSPAIDAGTSGPDSDKDAVARPQGSGYDMGAYEFINKPIVDFDGDGKTDIAVYHSASGFWFVRQSSDGSTFYLGYGRSAYVPVPGDYDGDGMADIAVYHPSSGLWFIRQSSDSSSYYVAYGGSEYTPVPGDYDGDRKTDVTVYHSASGLWFIKPSSGAADYYVDYGGTAYDLVPGDYDGDGKTDLALYRSHDGRWFIRPSSGAANYNVSYGGSAYDPVPGDFDGDGKTDVAVYHSTSGLWFIKKSSDGTSYYVAYGSVDYVPVPGDYDGDGKTDIAVYHVPSGLWFIKKSSDGTSYYVAYGGPAYTPVNMVYLLEWVY